MSTRLCLCSLALSAATSSLLADAKTQIADAVRPLDEGVPEVAVWRLQKLSGEVKGADAAVVKERLAEALIAAGRSAQALRVLDDAGMVGSGAAKSLRAQALAQAQRYEEALSFYRMAAADERLPQRAAAAFGAAEMLRALGRNGEAIRGFLALESHARFGVPARLRAAELFIAEGNAVAARQVLDSTQPKATADKRERRLLRARLELADGNSDKAIRLLESLVKKPAGATHETIVAALFAIADAHLLTSTPEAGDDYLEDFIDRYGDDSALGQVFAKLDQVYRAERKPPRNELEKWARDPAQPRRGFARWYLAKNDWRAGRREEALRQYEELRRSAPLPAALAPALVEYARLEIDAGRFGNAADILSAAEKTRPDARVRAEIDFESARAMYEAQRFREAATRFSKVTAPALANRALLNESVAWLEAGDSGKVESGARELAAKGDTNAQAELALEEALVAARQGEKRAERLLQDLLRENPHHSRAAEAELALAELTFHSAPPRIAETEKHLAAARAAHPSEQTKQRAAYLAVWLADAQAADSDAVISNANEFLRSYPQSELASEVRMKLAEAHFRRQDFANAQTQFETLAQENPKSPLTEKALFFAAQSAAAGMGSHSLERALELLTQVVKMNGGLRWAARNEQAAIERRLGKPQDAQVLYDEVLKSDAGAAEKREALCGKADIYFEQATAETSNLERAVALYDELANETANEPHWQNQALFKKGLCLEKSDRSAALEAFYRVLEFHPTPERPPEFFWFYKAGFNAARLLEEEQKWDSAAAVYERLVAASGPRSEEAKARLRRLRLEHFLWSD